MLGAVTHEELRRLLPAYAAGALDQTASEAIRAHLATGCGDCLRDVFGRPVGLPRFALVEARAPALEIESPAASPAAGRRHGGLVVAVLGLALALAAAVAWMVIELRGREAALRAEAQGIAARLAEAEAARNNLSGRVAALEREVAAAEERVSRQAEAAREAAEESARLAEENARLRDELEQARLRIGTLRRGLQLREGEIRPGAGGQDAPAELLATPGAELLPLAAVAPFRDVRGHVVWTPARDTGVVYLFRLPQPSAGGSYRVRVRLEGGEDVSGPPFTVGARGDAVVRLPLDRTGVRLEEVEVVLTPPERRVLLWQRRPPAG
jgi:hypothetical protein